DISDMSAEDIIRMDSKVFDIRDGKKARLSVLETTLPQNALDRKDELLTTMKEVMGADRLDEIFMYIVDILNEESTLLVATDSSQKLAESAYSVSVADNQATLDGMISRKKQLLPPLLD
ncbi:MAG: DHHA2 domain-containing protein, partial [Patescibacteria group bacterium]